MSRSPVSHINRARKNIFHSHAHFTEALVLKYNKINCLLARTLSIAKVNAFENLMEFTKTTYFALVTYFCFVPCVPQEERSYECAQSYEPAFPF